MDTKAAEIGLSARRLWQLRAAWRRDGVVGLCDKRKTRPRNPLGRTDPRIIAAIKQQAAAETNYYLSPAAPAAPSNPTASISDTSPTTPASCTATAKPDRPTPDGRWPIRRDPRNLLHAYFHEPADGHWHVLRWTAALDAHRPFTDTTLREARNLVGARGRQPTDQDEVATALLELQNRADDPDTWSRAERKRWARDTHRGAAQHRDRQRADPATGHTDGFDQAILTELHPASPDNVLDLDNLAAADICDPHRDTLPLEQPC